MTDDDSNRTGARRGASISTPAGTSHRAAGDACRDPASNAASAQGEDLVTERQLAARWAVSQRTLQRWRSEGFGPAWITIGGAIRYRLGDIRTYEAAMRRGGR